MLISTSVFALGNRHFNVYLAGGEEKVVIEGAVSAAAPAVRRQAGELGGIAGVSRLVVMHAHFDHVCGLPALKGIFPGASTAASAKAAEVLAKPSVVENFFREDAAMTAALGGRDGDEGGEAKAPQTIAVDEIIPDGTVWRLGPNFSLRFFRAPGHSPCSLAAYSQEEEVLFSSDSAGFPVDQKTSFPIYFEGYPAYVETIKRMLDLPVEVLAGGHEEIITGRRRIRAYLDLALDWAERTMTRTAEAAARGADPEDLAREIFSRFYHGQLKIYSRENIMLCSRLIVKRSLEAAERQGRP